VVSAQQIFEARRIINDIYIDDKVKDYIVDLVCATRDPEHYKSSSRTLSNLAPRPAPPSP